MAAYPHFLYACDVRDVDRMGGRLFSVQWVVRRLDTPTAKDEDCKTIEWILRSPRSSSRMPDGAELKTGWKVKETQDLIDQNTEVFSVNFRKPST